MVAIAVVAVMLGLAVPTFTSTINNNRLTSHANELVAAIQSSRMEAIRRNARVVLCSSADGATCDAGAGAWTGWVAFLDADANFAPDATAGALIRTGTINGDVTLLASPSVSGASNRMVVRPDGMVRSNDGRLLNAAFRVCMPTSLPPENVRDVTLDAGSRVSVERLDNGGACGAPANP
jgi:type IV fimbrial biogenesis protein FimT